MKASSVVGSRLSLWFVLSLIISLWGLSSGFSAPQPLKPSVLGAQTRLRLRNSHHSSPVVPPAPASAGSACLSALRMQQIAQGVERPILSPSAPDSPTSWDSGCVAMPVVLPPSSTNPKWTMFYYGNSGSWAGGLKCYLPTGWSGMAQSDDGIAWEKVPGPLEGGAIFGPDQGPDAWDSVHTGVGDVVRFANGTLHMYYFGGSNEELSMGPGSIAGFRMRIGKAVSEDGGMTWSRQGVMLDYEESEGFFASWPRIVVPSDDDLSEDEERSGKKPWRMIYHAFNGNKWRVFGATSTDRGLTWVRDEQVLLDAGSEEDFDFKGCGTRAVTRWKDGLVMVYEGVNDKMTHQLGAAFCSDPDGDYQTTGGWRKMEELGGPVLVPGGASGEWTQQVVGTPYLVPLEDGGLRLYHCAKQNSDTNMSIGVLVSDNGDLEATAWRPLAP